MTTRVAVYDVVTGKIASFMEIQPGDNPEDNVGAGQSWCEASEISGGHYIEDGSAKPYSARPGEWYVKEGKLNPLPPVPTPAEGFRFDLASEAWVDMRTPAELAEAEKDAFKRRRDAALIGGTTFSGMRLQTDDIAQSRITGAALAAMIDPTCTVQWKMHSGDFINLTGTQIIAVAQAIRAHVQACYDREAALIAALDAGQPYDIEAGWPS